MNTQHTPGRVTLFSPDPKWAQQMEDARQLDRYAVEHYGQRDRCHHFCAMQRQQQREGFLMVEISTNIYGYCVRDTMNDGQGILFGGRARRGATQTEAIEWARAWHAERPSHREVIAGYGFVREPRLPVETLFPNGQEISDSGLFRAIEESQP